MNLVATYRKVFSSSRYRATGQSVFQVDSKRRRLIVGDRTGRAQAVAFIGKVAEQGRVANLLDYDVYCDVSFPHVMGIFGSRGSGKSFDLGVFVEGLFPAEEVVSQTAPRHAAIIFDIQDQFWTLGYAPSERIPADADHLEELSRWGLRPRALPSVTVWLPRASDTQVPNVRELSLAANQLSTADWLAILELERFSAMGQALLALLNSHGFEPPSVLASHCTAGAVLSSFQQATIDGLRWRLEALANAQIIDEQGFEIDEFLKPESLSVILMRNLSDSIRALIVGVISRLAADRMGRLQQARKVALRTNTLSEPGSLTSRLWLILDEAHVLVPSDGSTAAAAPLIDYVKRGRDAGLSLIFATQQPSAVNSRLMSQVDMTLTHMLGFDADLAAAIARMPTRTTVEYEVDNIKVGSLSDVIRSLRPGEAVIADSASGRVFLAKIRPRMTAHGGATPS